MHIRTEKFYADSRRDLKITAPTGKPEIVMSVALFSIEVNLTLII